MTQRLTRVFLALAVAFVFTGRMEAAAAHCARLAHADDVITSVAAAETAPCHDSQAAMADKSAPQPMHHDKSADPCECLAVLKACTAVVAATASVQIEPYDWVRPEAIAFASIERSPALRPPRA